MHAGTSDYRSTDFAQAFGDPSRLEVRYLAYVGEVLQSNAARLRQWDPSYERGLCGSRRTDFQSVCMRTDWKSVLRKEVFALHLGRIFNPSASHPDGLEIRPKEARFTRRTDFNPFREPRVGGSRRRSLGGFG